MFRTFNFLKIIPLVIFSLSLQAVPSIAFPIYTAEYQVTLLNGNGFTVRANGDLYVGTSNTIRKISESTGLLSSTVYNPNQVAAWDTARGGTTQYIDQMVFHNNFIWGLFTSSKVFKLNPDGTGTFIPTPYNCANASTSSSIASSARYLVVTCSNSSDKTINLIDDIGGGNDNQSLTTSWTPGKVTIANGYMYVANLDSPFDLKKISISEFVANPNTATITSISTSNNMLGSSINLKITADNNYVWVTSGTDGNTVRVVRVSLANNSVSTIQLTGYVVGGSSPNFRVGGISSDNSTVYIALNLNPKVVAINASDLTWELIATPPTVTSVYGIEAISNGFWIAGNSKTFKYSYPRQSATDDSEEARKRRDAAINAARNALVTKIKAGQTIVNSDFIAADVTQFNSDLAERVNADFQIAATSKSFGFADVRTIITKWGIYQDIEKGVRSNVTGRLAYQAGIIPGTVARKQTLIAQLMNTEASARSSVEKIDALIATLAKKQSDQQNRKVAIINKIASGK